MGFNITKEWYLTGNNPGDMNIDPGLDPKLEDIGLGDNVLTAWDVKAQNQNDDYMKWLLKPALDEVFENVWTQFSFDLIQLWIKNFEIHIDVAEILEALFGGGGSNPEIAIVNAFLDVFNIFFVKINFFRRRTIIRLKTKCSISSSTYNS